MSASSLTGVTGAKRVSGVIYLAFFVTVALGGSNAVAVRFSNLELPPFWGATLRFSTAAALFWAIVLLRRIQIPRGRALYGALIFGGLSIGITYALLYWALVFVPASLAMVVLSLGPLFTFFFALAHGQETFRWRGLLGALVAFTGILIAVGGEIGSTIPVPPLLAIVVGAASTSEASVLLKSFPKSHPMVVNALALTVGAPILLLLSIITGEVRSLPASTTTWISFGYLVLGGSVLLFYLYLFVLQNWTASATSYAFLLFPVATVIIAAWLADETISPRFILGGAIVLLGVWQGAIHQPKEEKMVPARVPSLPPAC